MKRELVLLAILGLFCSCKQDEAIFPDSVVLILDNCPVQTSTTRFNSHLSQVAYSTISYIDRTGDLVQYIPRSLGQDTLVIPTFHGYAEVMHLYQAIEFDTFLLKAGDTVLVSYNQQQRPLLTSLVFGDYTEIYNLPYTSTDAIQSRGYFIETVLNNQQFTVPYRYFKDKNNQSRYPSLKEAFKDRYVNLDSLSYVYDGYLASFIRKIDSLENVSRIDAIYARYLRTRFVPDERFSPEECVQSDSLLHYISNYVRAQEYCPGHKILARFDKMAEDTLSTALAKKGILKRLLNQIISGEDGWHLYPTDIVDSYTSRYVSITGDSSYVQKVNSIPVTVSDSSFNLPIEDKDGQKTTLKTIIEQSKGSVVYVDFWASWCAPCRAEMPSSRQLQKQFSGQGITFLFLSTDTNRNAWLEAINEEAETMLSSYRILDLNHPFLKELRLDSIPRYIIFDADGDLVDINAERPSSKDVARALDSFINQGI